MKVPLVDNVLAVDVVLHGSIFLDQRVALNGNNISV